MYALNDHQKPFQDLYPKCSFHIKTLYFDNKFGRNSAITQNQSGTPIMANSVDNLIFPDPVTVIKFDVEGAEETAILGCAKSIEKYTPHLLVSAYHKNSDLFLLPLLINSINSDYKLYLRHHPYIPAWETNYYFVKNSIF